MDFGSVFSVVPLGLVCGAFARMLMIGDGDVFDWGGPIGALLGTLIVIGLAGWLLPQFMKK